MWITLQNCALSLVNVFWDAMGFPEHDYQLIGRLTRSNGDPLSHQWIRAISSTFFNDTCLNEANCDEEGRFNIRIRWRWTPISSTPDLYLQIMERCIPSKEDPWKRPTGHVFEKIPLPAHLKDIEEDVGTLISDIHAFHPHLPIPHKPKQLNAQGHLDLRNLPQTPLLFVQTQLWPSMACLALQQSCVKHPIRRLLLPFIGHYPYLHAPDSSGNIQTAEHLFNDMEEGMQQLKLCFESLDYTELPKEQDPLWLQAQEEVDHFFQDYGKKLALHWKEIYELSERLVFWKKSGITDNPELPSAEDLERLRAFCTYTIYQVKAQGA